ncbi:Mediator of RNA polymerase II transcription subunit 25 [Acorus calamus]|uniref:Mediator of RNA polymerase II transcription subunit 25 n=1 Tax=Acorus calamus TaxID=4465 RepID=A0AAV9DXY9_ACOCL|nr:Mediator of RNA polymerase II transcription subunit 25 [Acorus calamus]
MVEKQLIIAVEGTAAMGPYWRTIVSDYLEKIISDEEGHNGNYKRDSKGRNGRKRRVVLDSSDEDIEDENAMSLASPGFQQEQLAPDSTCNAENLTEKGCVNLEEQKSIKLEIKTLKEAGTPPGFRWIRVSLNVVGFAAAAATTEKVGILEFLNGVHLKASMEAICTKIKVLERNLTEMRLRLRKSAEEREQCSGDGWSWRRQSVVGSVNVVVGIDAPIMDSRVIGDPSIIADEAPAEPGQPPVLHP